VRYLKAVRQGRRRGREVHALGGHHPIRLRGAGPKDPKTRRLESAGDSRSSNSGRSRKCRSENGLRTRSLTNDQLNAANGAQGAAPYFVTITALAMPDLAVFAAVGAPKSYLRQARSIAEFALHPTMDEQVYRLRGFVGYQIDLEFEGWGIVRRTRRGRHRRSVVLRPGQSFLSETQGSEGLRPI